MAIEVEEVRITGNTAHWVQLNSTPVNPTEVAVDPFGGPAQVYGVDFVVAGSILSWDLPESDIKKVVAGGYDTKIRILYER